MTAFLVLSGVGADPGRIARCPPPEPLCDNLQEPNGIRAIGSKHPIQDRDADGRLGLPGGEAACSRPRSDQRLIAAYRRFDERPLAIVCRLCQASRPFSVIISRSCSSLSTSVERGGITISISSPCTAGGVVGRSAILSAVSCYPRGSAFNLIQQRRHLRHRNRGLSGYSRATKYSFL